MVKTDVYDFASRVQTKQHTMSYLNKTNKSFLHKRFLASSSTNGCTVNEGEHHDYDGFLS